MIELRHFTCRYPGAQRPALDDVSFALAEGERVALVGANGAGKSTLLRALAEAAPPLANGLPRCALVPPDDPADLALTGHDFVMLGRTPHLSAWRRPSPADESAVAQALVAVGATAFVRRRLDTLSSGERRRLALALALATEAPVLLLDEPTAHLDAEATAAFYALLKATGRTFVLSTHAWPLPAGLFTRCVRLAHGKIFPCQLLDISL